MDGRENTHDTEVIGDQGTISENFVGVNQPLTNDTNEFGGQGAPVPTTGTAPTVWSAQNTADAEEPQFPMRRTTLALALLCVVTGALMVLMGVGVTAGGLMQVSICLLCLGAVLVISAVVPTGKKSQK